MSREHDVDTPDGPADLRATSTVSRYIQERAVEHAATRVLDRFRKTIEPAAPARHSPPPPAAPPMMRLPQLRTLAPVLALVVLALWVGWPRRPPAPALALTPPAGASVDGHGGATQVRAGSLVRASAPCTLSLGGLALELKPGAGLRVLALPEAPRSVDFALRQESGEAVYGLERGGRSGLSIEVPGGRVRVTGTRFRVRVTETATEIEVGEGTVEVVGSTTLPLSAAHATRLRPDGRVDAPRPFNLIADPDFTDTERIGTGTSR